MDFFKRKRGSARKDINALINDAAEIVRRFGSSISINERGASGNSSMSAPTANLGEGGRVLGGQSSNSLAQGTARSSASLPVPSNTTG